MFSSNIWALPSCASYEGALRIWERAPVPRNKAKWPEGTRPLDDARKTHYAVILDGSKVAFRLYNTNVVEWYSPTHFLLNSNYDTISTRSFANRYMPGFIGFETLRDEGRVLKMYNEMFCRGTHEFKRKDDGIWECITPKVKPRRSVLDPQKRKEVEARLKPLFQWIRSIWAVFGDGNHPWVDTVKESPYYAPNENILSKLKNNTIEEFHAVVKDCIRSHMASLTLPDGTRAWDHVYSRQSAADLIANIRKSVHYQEGVHMKIDYDAPIPKLEKTK